MILKSFPGIGDPGADRILLFAGIVPVATVPSNCVHVLIRVLKGTESKSYSADYRDAQRALLDGVPEALDPRTRAYLLLMQHGQVVCKRSNPKCEICPLNANCAYVGSNFA